MILLWRKDSNLRMAALTVRCLTSLATPQKNDEGDKGEIVKRAAIDDKVTNMRITSFPVARFSFLFPFSRSLPGCGSRSRTCRTWLMRPLSRPCSIPASVSECVLEATKGFEPLSTGLQDRRSEIQLSYIARQNTIFGLWSLVFGLWTLDFGLSSLKLAAFFIARAH